MVNVDLSPALLLGLGMIGGGLLLYNVRVSRPEVSRDNDVVISSIAVLVGGILVFQGWRLDPLLLFGQLLTAGTATAFALEVFRLREIVASRQSTGEPEGFGQGWTSADSDIQGSLPEPEADRDYQRWNTDESQQTVWPSAGPEASDEFAEPQPAYFEDDGYAPSSDSSGYSSGANESTGRRTAAGRSMQQRSDNGGALRDRRLDYSQEIEDW